MAKVAESKKNGEPFKVRRFRFRVLSLFLGDSKARSKDYLVKCPVEGFAMEVDHR